MEMLYIISTSQQNRKKIIKYLINHVCEKRKKRKKTLNIYIHIHIHIHIKINKNNTTNNIWCCVNSFKYAIYIFFVTQMLKEIKYPLYH